jgi:hypothetical protein
MNLRLIIVLVVLAAILLALGGWAVDGARWVVRGGWIPRRERVAPAPA